MLPPDCNTPTTGYFVGSDRIRLHAGIQLEPIFGGDPKPKKGKGKGKGKTKRGKTGGAADATITGPGAGNPEVIIHGTTPKKRGKSDLSASVEEPHAPAKKTKRDLALQKMSVDLIEA